MPEHVDAAFVFGSLGNLSEAMGEGWSVEDNYAWAVGAESRLNLPLPGDSSRYVLRLTVQPLLRPGVLDAQRLSVDTVAGLLGSFSIERRTTIELPLPIELTSNSRRLELILRHPDALRPSDFKDTNDGRLLSVCFMSGALARQPDGTGGQAAEPASLCHVIIAGGDLARQLSRVMAALPSLHRRVACHFVNTHQDLRPTPPPDEALQSAALCWEQSGGNDAAGWPALRRRLPAGCDVRRFASPRMGALWPFLTTDPRLTLEPGRYPGGRYPFGDRIGVSLANLQLSDDVTLLSYHSMAEKEMPDLDALLATDRAAWRQLDATHDVKIADFMVESFRRYRLFFSPVHTTGELLHELIVQLVANSPVEAFCRPAKLRKELDFLLAGYIGPRVELPILPAVARRFGLAWWEPDMRYCWHGNHWTFEEYMLRYIRWTPWRP
jgi:hypothetical protein